MRVLVLINFQDDCTPRRLYHKVGIRARSLGIETTAFEWKMMLVAEVDPSIAQELVNFQFFGLRDGFGGVSVLGTHVVQEICIGTEPLTMAELTHKIVAIATATACFCVLADATSTARNAHVSFLPMFAKIAAVARPTIVAVLPMQAN
jgi:hypothetical protein